MVTRIALSLSVVAVGCFPESPPSSEISVSPPPSPPALAAAPPAATRPGIAPATRAVLAQGLASKSYAIRLAATEALGCLPGPDAETWLETQLGDPEPDVRAAAVLSLARRIGPRPRALLASVRDDAKEHLDLRVLAAASLVTPTPCP